MKYIYTKGIVIFLLLLSVNNSVQAQNDAANQLIRRVTNNTAKNISTWGSSILYYDPEHTRRAAEKLLSVADKFKDNDNFKYDLVDVLRQSLADKAKEIYKQIFNK